MNAMQSEISELTDLLNYYVKHPCWHIIMPMTFTNISLIPFKKQNAFSKVEWVLCHPRWMVVIEKFSYSLIDIRRLAIITTTLLSPNCIIHWGLLCITLSLDGDSWQTDRLVTDYKKKYCNDLNPTPCDIVMRSGPLGITVKVLAWLSHNPGLSPSRGYIGVRSGNAPVRPSENSVHVRDLV